MNYREPQSLNRLTILGAQLASFGLAAGSVFALATGAAAVATPLAVPLGIIGAANFFCANKAGHVRSIHVDEEKELRQAQAAGVAPKEHYSDHLNQHKQLSPLITKTARFGAIAGAVVGIALCVIAAPALITGALTASIAPATIGLLSAGIPTLATSALLMRTSEVADVARGYAYSSAAQKERDMTARRIEHDEGKHNAPSVVPQQQSTEISTHWRDKIASHQEGKGISR